MVSGVYDRDAAVAAGIKRARLMELLAPRRGGWLSVGMATDDIDGLATRLTRAGMDVFGPYAMRRECPDGRTLQGRVLQPGGSALRRPWPCFVQWELPDRQLFAAPPRHKLAVTSVAGVVLLVRNLKAAEYLYEEQLGFRPGEKGAHETPGAMSAHYWMRDFHVELVAPTSPGPMLDRLEAQGEGICAVRLCVGNLAAECAKLEARGAMTAVRGEQRAEVFAPGTEAFGARFCLQELTSVPTAVDPSVS